MAVSPMDITQKSPAACWAVVGGHGKAAASVVAFPEVWQSGMAMVVVVEPPRFVMQTGVPATGGPTVPLSIVWVPVRVPLAAPFEPIEVRARAEQLTGMYSPRKTIWG